MVLNRLLYFLLFFFPSLVLTADSSHGSAPHLNGEGLAIFWVIPFVGILLSIAVMPLVAEEFWHHNFGKISLFISSCVLRDLLDRRITCSTRVSFSIKGSSFSLGDVLLDLFMKLSLLGVQELEVLGSLGVIFAHFYYLLSQK